jgi:hypothetical protein
MRTDVMTSQVTVRRQGAQQFFSMSLPVDVVRIVGVETGISMASPLTNGNRQTAGTLRLQAADKANICFCGDVKTGVTAPEGLTPGFPVPDAETGSSLLTWASQPFVAGGAYEPESILLKDCRTIYGCYSDELGRALKADLHYTVSFFLWIEVKTDKNE